MKNISTILTILLSLSLAGTAFAQNQYGWSISNSTTDPFSNTGTATNGVASLYLWYECSTLDGMSAAEFDIAATGTVSHLATTPTNGYLNAGGASNLLLAVGGCPAGPIIACNLLVLDLPGELCIVASAANGENGTVDCQSVPTLFPNTTNGYSSTGGSTCVHGNPLCEPDAVESFSWGTIKGLYH